MAKKTREYDTDLAVRIVATFSALIHHWQANEFAKAAAAKAELERLGVKVTIPARRRGKAVRYDA